MINPVRFFPVRQEETPNDYGLRISRRIARIAAAALKAGLSIGAFEFVFCISFGLTVSAALAGTILVVGIVFVSFFIGAFVMASRMQ